MPNNVDGFLTAVIQSSSASLKHKYHSGYILIFLNYVEKNSAI